MCPRRSKIDLIAKNSTLLSPVVALVHVPTEKNVMAIKSLVIADPLRSQKAVPMFEYCPILFLKSFLDAFLFLHSF